jgi:RHS repeat-associated protein
VVLTGAAGKPIERYTYSPYGDQTILVDATPPAIEQLRAKDGALWLEISEEVQLEPLVQALAAQRLTLTVVATSEALPLTADQPVRTGRQARRRLVLTTTAPPAAGTEVRLRLEPEALVDLFLNTPASAFEHTFPWPAADQLLLDTTPPRLSRVLVRAQRLELELTEEPDLAAAAAAITVDGAPATWTLAPDRYTLVGDSTLLSGPHTVTISTAALDLAGLGMAAAFEQPFTLAPGAADRLVHTAPDPREVSSSAAGNPFGFHGLVKDGETGLLYVRNRYFDAELGRFVTVDPMGFVDGPNLYAFALNNPANYSDPLGLEAEGEDEEESCFSSWGAAWDCLVEPLVRLSESWPRWDQHLRESAGARRDPTDTGLDALAEQTRLTGEVAGDAFDAGLRISDAAGAGGLVRVAIRVGGRIVTKQVAKRHLPELLHAGWEVVDDDVAELGARRVPRAVPRIHMGKQGKHIPGHSNYIEGRSILRADPEALAARAGTGQPVNRVPRGQPGFKERVDFGEVIGDFVEEGVATPTTKGIITYAVDGTIHIVPVRP